MGAAKTERGTGHGGAAGPLGSRPHRSGRDGAALLRATIAASRLAAAPPRLIVHWLWMRRRGTAAFRQALRQAGLPPRAVASLVRSYTGSVSPVHLWRLLRTRR